jgi:uncharacterized membrane protein
MTFKLSSLTEFLLTLALSGILLACVFFFDESNTPTGIVVIRFFVGLVAVLFIPGYFLQMSLFPVKEDLDTVERIALSIGISLAIIPPITLALDMSPWTKLDQTAIFASEALITTIGIVFLQIRRLGISEKDRYYFGITIESGEWWQSQTLLNRMMFTIFCVAMLGVFIAVLLILLGQQPAAQSTEFYILGHEQLAEGFPIEIERDQPITLLVGVTNRENEPLLFRIEARQNNNLIATVPPFSVEADETIEHPLIFTPTDVGEDAEVQFFLFQDESQTPFRSLRIFLSVDQPSLTRFWGGFLFITLIGVSLRSVPITIKPEDVANAYLC